MSMKFMRYVWKSGSQEIMFSEIRAKVNGRLNPFNLGSV